MILRRRGDDQIGSDDFPLLAMDVLDHAPVMPHCNTSWNEFLSGTGETTAALWNFLKYMEDYAKAVRARKLKHPREKATAYRRSTTSQPRSLG
ncbi:hypothetical protein EDD21DRAFT_409960 [Dissophora ornata]|nr:hypothetical protein EDD21DRAFT_409960 [Dissophora ornata]